MRALKRQNKGMEECRRLPERISHTKQQMAVRPSEQCKNSDDESVEMTPVPSIIEQDSCISEEEEEEKEEFLEPEDQDSLIVFSDHGQIHSNSYIAVSASEPFNNIEHSGSSILSRITSRFRNGPLLQKVAILCIGIAMCVLLLSAIAIGVGLLTVPPPPNSTSGKNQWQMCWNMQWRDAGGMDNVQDNCVFCQKGEGSNLRCVTGDSSSAHLNLTMTKPKHGYIEELSVISSDGRILSMTNVKFPVSFSSDKAVPYHSLRHHGSRQKKSSWFGFLIPPSE